MNYMEAAFAPAERVYKRTMTHATFGHLRAAARTKYRGWILFTHGCYGDITIIEYVFRGPDGGELNASPWICEHIYEYVSDRILPKRAYKSVLPRGRIYRFDGTYETYEDTPKGEDSGSDLLEEGGYRFRGRVRRVRAGGV